MIDLHLLTGLQYSPVNLQHYTRNQVSLRRDYAVSPLFFPFLPSSDSSMGHEKGWCLLYIDLVVIIGAWFDIGYQLGCGLAALTCASTGTTSKKGLFSCHRFWESSSFEGFKDAGNQQEVIVPASTSGKCFYYWKLLRSCL